MQTADCTVGILLWQKMKLVDLNIDCLLHIFSYCNEKDLLSLCRANIILRNVINDHIFYKQTFDLLMCGIRGNPKIQERTIHPLSYASRLSISRNWIQGRYYETEYFPHKQMFPTKLHLERNWLYLTHANFLRQHRRLLKTHHEALQRSYQKEISSGSRTDIADFVKKRETIFAARVCGNCFIHENENITEQRLHPPKEYMHCVDFAGDIYASSSEQTARLWRRAEEFGLIHLDLMFELKHAYKAFKFSDDSQHLFGGLYTDVGRLALREIDVETGLETALNSNTISIYDLKLKDENVLFTANFDTTFRMHDRRANKDVAIWEDLFDSSFYCLEYDGLYAVLCGTKYHGRVNLYDIRVPKKYVQLYFPRRRNHLQSSPVYSIACDSRYLFVATDHNLRVFDFKADCASSRDYRNIFSETHRVENWLH